MCLMRISGDLALGDALYYEFKGVFAPFVRLILISSNQFETLTCIREFLQVFGAY